MATDPVVSIIIPTHNRVALLPTTIDSATSQAAVPVEVVIVDDGSTDGTWEYLVRLSQIDQRMRPFRHRSALGAPAARNRGLKEARGEWVNFLDSDDLLHPRKLELQLEPTKHRDLDCVVCQTGVFGEGLTEKYFWNRLSEGDNLLNRFLKHDVAFHTSAPIFRRGFALDVGGYDEEARSAQDFEFHVRCLVRNPRVHVLPVVLNFFRQHTADRISSQEIDHGLILAEVTLRLAKALRVCSSEQKAIFSDLCFWHCINQTKFRHYKLAARLFIAALILARKRKHAVALYHLARKALLGKRIPDVYEILQLEGSLRYDHHCRHVALTPELFDDYWPPTDSDLVRRNLERSLVGKLGP